MARYSEQGGLVATHQDHCFLDTFSKQQVPVHGGYRSLFGNKVHETAIVDWNNVEIGTGNVIGPYACLGGDAHKNTCSAILASHHWKQQHNPRFAFHHS